MPLLKVLLIISLIAYVLYKVGGFFFRIGAASQRHVRDTYQPRQQPPKKDRRNGKIKGGEYVDYEEVK